MLEEYLDKLDSPGEPELIYAAEDIERVRPPSIA